MPLCLVVGMPQHLRNNRIPRIRIERADWEFQWIDSHKSRVVLADIWDAVVARADAFAGAGVHIFAFFATRGEREEYESSVLLRHRLIWLTQNDQDRVTAGQFVDRLHELLAFEEQWCHEIRPADVRDALVLPNVAFEARPPLDSYWRRAARVMLGGDETLEEIAAQGRGFREAYYSRNADCRGNWCDEGDRIFTVPDPRIWHANNVPASSRWKLTWDVPHGFHYDVRHLRGGAFNICDASGEKRRVAEYINVYTHNEMR
jgi:hypothetical protein